MVPGVELPEGHDGLHQPPPPFHPTTAPAQPTPLAGLGVGRERCAGERCLAGSVLVGVGDAYDKLKDQVLKEVSKVVVGNGLDAKTTLGPVISKEAKERILKDIDIH